MKVTFWGTRGSIPSPGYGTAGFGGNTPCVQVQTAAGTHIILDCGTGVRALGDHLCQAYPAGCRGHILLSHTHWDHIQGFPFFAPAFDERYHFSVHAPAGGERSLIEALSGQMQYTYFPISLEQLQAGIECVDLQEGDFHLDEVLVRTHYLNHPGLTLGYRLEAGGVAVVYATDHAPFGSRLFPQQAGHGSLELILHEGDRQHAQFVAGADLLIHDCQYTAAEYEQRRNWGHSPLEYTVPLAVAAGVKQLALFHHDPNHDDRFLAQMEQAAATLALSLGSTLDVISAREGQTLDLQEQLRLRYGTRPLRTPLAVAVAAARILVIGEDRPLRDLLMTALRDGGNRLIMARDGAEALHLAPLVYPDLVLLDLDAVGPHGIGFLRTLRAHPDPRLRSVPVLVLTASDDEQQVSAGFALGATDYIHKPVTPAQLRTRVRTWLERLAAQKQP